MTLHVFADEEDADYVVAASPDDAAIAWCEHTLSPTGDAGTFYQIDDARVLSIRNEESDPLVKKTAAEWATSNGRGFLCSTEY